MKANITKIHEGYAAQVVAPDGMADGYGEGATKLDALVQALIESGFSYSDADYIARQHPVIAAELKA